MSRTVTIDVPEGFRLVIKLEPVEDHVHEPRPSPVNAGGAPRIVMAEPRGKYAPVAARIDGDQVELPACVAEVLHEVAYGNGFVRFRPETRAKLEESAPWALAGLERDHGVKVYGNKHTYQVAPWLRREVVIGTSSNFADNQADPGDAEGGRKESASPEPPSNPLE